MPNHVPDRGLQLRTVVTEAGTVELSLVEVEVPAPRAAEVVIEVEAAPINPSDLGLLLAGADPAQGVVSGTAERPVFTAPLPPAAQRAAAARTGRSMPAGNEGAGTVVAAGNDPRAQHLLGRVVAVAGGAMYSQYRVVDAASCLPLPEGASARDGAAAFVNPLTALGMVETMRAEGHAAMVHTAAASNLGQMLQRLCLEEGVALVNIVRSDAQAAIMTDIGAAHVCDSSREDFMARLTDSVGAVSATLAFDAVGGGRLASSILTAMEAAAGAGTEFSRYGSSVHKQVYIYGGLDRGPTELTRSYGMAWGVGGWLLTPFLEKVGPDKVQELRGKVASGLTTTFASHFTDTVSLAGAVDPRTVAAYARQATGQKYLVVPSG
ncbi:MAG TPA: zinc-binding dehydrogenase [Acidimicrobiales bacterium]|nr:zinc-binding dehydrogenase [Acidimicrobiales bacterium]